MAYGGFIIGRRRGTREESRLEGTRFSLSMEMSRLTRDGTAESVSRDQILRHAPGQGNINFPCSADHVQDWQPYPVDPYSTICDDHTYIHTPSGQSRVYRVTIAYRWRSLPRVRRHRASKPQGSSERVLPWQVTMDQLIFASLSHAHFWYEVGMLKVPAVCSINSCYIVELSSLLIISLKIKNRHKDAVRCSSMMA